MAQPPTIKINDTTVCTMIQYKEPDATHDSYLYAMAHALSQKEVAEKIVQAYDLTGGWESWAQVECALGLAKVFPKEGIEREKQIYGNSDRIDLWAQAPGHDTAGIEMKCRNKNFGGWEAQNGIAGQTSDDIGKVSNFANAHKGSKAALYAIGITTNPYDLIWSSKIGNNAPYNTHWQDKGNVYPNLNWFYLQRDPQYDLEQSMKLQRSGGVYLVWFKLIA